MKVYVVTGDSESSDHYGPLVFSKKPTKKKLSEIAHNWDGDDEKQGSGEDGSYVYIEVDCVEVDG